MPNISRFTIELPSEDHQAAKVEAVKAKKPLYKWAGEIVSKALNRKAKKP